MGVCALPWNQATLPPLTSTERKQCGPPVRRNPQGSTQTTMEVTCLPGVDISRDLAPCLKYNRSALGPSGGVVTDIRVAP